MMLLWGVGLPLLIWHRLARLSRAYVWFSLVFVLGSVVSHQLLGECVLTTLARVSWESAGGQPEAVPFIVRFTNWVAGVRPSARAAVLVWEVAIALYCVAFLWGWRRLASRSAPSRSTTRAEQDRPAC
jgi:hypothetical protein